MTLGRIAIEKRRVAVEHAPLQAGHHQRDDLVDLLAVADGHPARRGAVGEKV